MSINAFIIPTELFMPTTTGSTVTLGRTTATLAGTFYKRSAGAGTGQASFGALIPGDLASGATNTYALTINASGNLVWSTPLIAAVSTANGLYLNGSTLTLSGTSSMNFGSVTLAGNLIVTGGGTLTTAGALNLTGGFSFAPGASLGLSAPAIITNQTSTGTTAGTATSITTGGPNTVGLVVNGQSYTPPAVLLAGYVVDFDANQLVYKDAGTTLAADGDAVQQWNKAGGSGGANLSQGSLTLRPLLKTNIINGLPVIRFDGVNDFISAAFTLAQPYTIVFVYTSRVIGAGLVNDIILDGKTGIAVYSVDSSPRSDIYAGHDVPDATARTAGTFYRMMCIFNGTSSSMIRNGASVASGNAGTLTPGGLTVGAFSDGSRPAQVDVARIIIYPSVLNSTDQATVDNYLATVYFTPTTTHQTADLQQWCTSSAGTPVVKITAAGNLIASGTANNLETLGVKSGANKSCGTVALVAGTMTISNTRVTALSQIQLTSIADGGTPGFLRITAITAGTSFAITSSNALDTSTVAWLIVEPT